MVTLTIWGKYGGALGADFDAEVCIVSGQFEICGGSISRCEILPFSSCPMGATPT